MSLTSKKFWAVSLLVGAQGLFAEHAPSTAVPTTPAEIKKRVCEIPAQGFIREVKSDNIPSYFFKTHPDNDWVCYISGGNHVLNMSTGEDRRSPGFIDDMFTPDGKYYVVPNSFYKTEDALNNPNATSVYNNLRMSSYQSVGMLSSDATKSIYRYTDGFSFTDLEFTHNPGGQPTVRVVKPQTPMCPGISRSLPMISKDGKYLSGTQSGSGPATTKIWKINDDGTCEQVEDLGIATGKVEFAYDNDWLAFHVFNNEGSNTTFGQPSASWVGNIYAYQRSTKKFHRMTSNTKFSSVYPSWKRDGTLVYMNHYAGTSNKNTGFVHAAPPNIGEKNLKKYVIGSTSTDGEKKEYNTRVALGALWAQTCSAHFDRGGTLHTVLDSMGMGKTECQLLVKNYWNDAGKTAVSGKFGSELKNFTTDDLLRECPTTELPTGGGRPNDPTNPNRPPQPVRPKVRAVPQDCRDCHATIPFDNLEELRTAISTHAGNRPMIDEILRLARLPDSDPHRMPPPDSGLPRLTEQQLIALERYLRGQGDAPVLPTTPAANPSH